MIAQIYTGCFGPMELHFCKDTTVEEFYEIIKPDPNHTDDELAERLGDSLLQAGKAYAAEVAFMAQDLIWCLMAKKQYDWGTSPWDGSRRGDVAQHAAVAIARGARLAKSLMMEDPYILSVRRDYRLLTEMDSENYEEWQAWFSEQFGTWSKEELAQCPKHHQHLLAESAKHIWPDSFIDDM